MYLYRPPGLYAAITAAPFETNKLRFTPDAWLPSRIAAEFPKLKEHFLLFRPFFRQRNFAEWYDEAANCLSYVMGDRTLLGQRVTGSSNLGALSGHEVKRRFLTSGTVAAMAEKEGMKLTDDRMDFGHKGRVAALYLDEQHDYHWVKVHTIRSTNANKPNFFLSHKRRRHRPSLVTLCGKPIGDPRQISFKRDSYEIAPNPKHKALRRCYNFLSYVNLPPELNISPRVIAKRKNYIERQHPKKAAEWSTFLQRLADPKTGGVLVPQCWADEAIPPNPNFRSITRS